MTTLPFRPVGLRRSCSAVASVRARVSSPAAAFPAGGPAPLLPGGPLGPRGGHPPGGPLRALAVPLDQFCVNPAHAGDPLGRGRHDRELGALFPGLRPAVATAATAGVTTT